MTHAEFRRKLLHAQNKLRDAQEALRDARDTLKDLANDLEPGSTIGPCLEATALAIGRTDVAAARTDDVVRRLKATDPAATRKS